MKKGTLMIVSGPAGVGKGTVVANAVEKSGNNIYLSISATTRTPRSIDKEGITYFFKTKEAFEKMIENNELLEWASYADNYYGTPSTPVLDSLNQGKDVILEIEVQGAFLVKKNYKDAIMVFISPPNLEELEKRLRNRQTETEEQIQTRLSIAKNELNKSKLYDYIIENDTISQASDDILAILRCQKLKV